MRDTTARPENQGRNGLGPGLYQNASYFQFAREHLLPRLGPRVSRAPLVRVYDRALPEALFRRLDRAFLAVGRERLRATYQTTFWFPLGARPTSLVELAALELRPLIPARAAGVEWWLSRMRPTSVQVDFHRDHDIHLAERTGRMAHPAVSSVLFLNRVRGGLLAVTAEPPEPDNPACAPDRLDRLDLVAPRPNRLATFDGRLTHGVLDAENQVPSGRDAGPARMRRAVILNWWRRRPEGVPGFGEVGAYRPLRLGGM
jgi:hypothetical protein